VGTVLTDSILLRSVSDAPFEVEKIETSTPDLIVEPVESKFAEGKLYQVRHKAAKAGANHETVRFTVRAESRPPLVIEVAVTWHGLATDTLGE
jgi:hypothetical protein